MASFRLRGNAAALAVVVGIVLLAPTWNAPAQEFPVSSQVDRARLADGFMSRGEYDKAEAILVELIREQPESLPILDQLQRLYTEKKEFDKAIDFVGRIEKLTGATTEICLTYGDLFLKSGSPENAREHFNRALTGGLPDKKVYPRIANVYRVNGMYDGAVQTYLEAKSQFDDPALFAFELGQLYEVSRNYAAAAREYCVFIASDTANIDRGDRLISRLIDYADDPDDTRLLKEVFAEMTNSEPDAFEPRKYLAEILIRQDSLERAYELFVEVDRLTDDKGRLLVVFARRCMERSKPEIAARACEYVLERYPGQPFYIHAHYVLSSAFVMMGHADSAVAILQEVREIAPMSRDKVEADFVTGDIYLQYLKDPDSALEYFERVMKGSPPSGWHFRAMLRMGDCHLTKGDLAAAESLYASIDTKLLSDEDRELLIWNRAQARFFMHEFKDAKKLYADLTVRYRKGVYVNDCLRRILMIDENSGEAVQELGLFADAEFFIERAEYDSAEARLTQLAGMIISDLADISTYRLGVLYSELGRSEEAITVFERVLSDFKESFWRGESQKHIADIYLAQGRLQDARDAYHSLLTDYDAVLLQDHARKKLKELGDPQL